MTSTLPSITPEPRHNYVAFFLTLACNLNCPWCINLHHRGGDRRAARRRRSMSADEWIRAANRLVLRPDLPLTLQGGEPTLHRGFFRLVNAVRDDIRMDLITNLMFDVEAFIRNVPVWRFTRDAPYAAIRASYHPGQNDIEDLIGRARRLQRAGFRIGLYGILHPDESVRAHILQAQARCLALGLDFRTKEFLGDWKGRRYGTFKYPDSVGGRELKTCACKTTELLVDPQGHLFRCHSDLYAGRAPIAHVLDDDFSIRALDAFRPCPCYGDCNPCDVKVKTNRFQVFGHTSVEIRAIKPV